jgi:putative redox protein
MVTKRDEMNWTSMSMPVVARPGIRHPPGGGDDTGAAVTPAEARQLAAALLRQAAAAEHPEGDTGPGRMVADYAGGETYAATTRGHTVLTDQPATAGGDDSAMTPVELFVAALGACAAFYAGRYLDRHGLDRDGLQVAAEFGMATDRPARVRWVTLKIRVPGGVPLRSQAALLAVVAHCTVHNTLRQAPEVAIELA